MACRHLVATLATKLNNISLNIILSIKYIQTQLLNYKQNCQISA